MICRKRRELQQFEMMIETFFVKFVVAVHATTLLAWGIIMASNNRSKTMARRALVFCDLSFVSLYCSHLPCNLRRCEPSTTVICVMNATRVAVVMRCAASFVRNFYLRCMFGALSRGKESPNYMAKSQISNSAETWRELYWRRTNFPASQLNSLVLAYCPTDSRREE